ncbi:hypothetical protein D8I35_05385 [Corticibacter populi]|uniref:Uncharacterized protein n=1 Tax=Corticibacter populi TaxID=1550736 RepID=A0A3M6QZS3_9BURK|nr:hypothetical protein [Corticibacter populi]RMX08510.1 hypothetical protein D8I35_05385 [Corticibacter populi]RZS35823.1 hypothetical protein EV687_0902 [Corticibacter populi]
MNNSTLEAQTAHSHDTGSMRNRISSTQRVYDAVRDLREADQIATRETVAEASSLKLSIVDDRLRSLVDDGRLKRLIRGVYELVEVFPEPRALSCTIQSDGWIKVELGDELLTMTPSEARRLARALGGFVEDVRVIESTKAHLLVATELAASVEAQAREIKALRKHIRTQPDLLEK